MGTALLALLSIIFFSIMTEQGLFDPFVNFLVSKAGNNVAVITVISRHCGPLLPSGYRHYQHIAGLQFPPCCPFTGA